MQHRHSQQQDVAGIVWYPGQVSGGKRVWRSGAPVAFFLALLLIFKSFARKSFLPLCYHPSVGGSGRG